MLGTAEKSGNLDAVLEIKKEIEGFRTGNFSPAENSGELRQAQGIFRNALKRRRSDFRRDVRPLLLQYQSKLSDLGKQETVTGNVANALLAKKEAERISNLLNKSLPRITIELGLLDEGFDPAKSQNVAVTPEDKSTVAEVRKLRAETLAATNRPYQFTGVPEEFIGFSVLCMEVRGNLTYSYQLPGKSLLYLLVHSDNLKSGSNPQAEQWKETEHRIIASGGFFVVFEKEHKKGNYELTTQGPLAIHADDRW